MLVESILEDRSIQESSDFCAQFYQQIFQAEDENSGKSKKLSKVLFGLRSTKHTSLN